MGLARKGDSDFPRLESACFLADGKVAFALNNKVDLVISLMAVNFLFLARFQAVEVAEHPRALKQIELLHLLGAELNLVGDLFYVHRLDCSWNSEGLKQDDPVAQARPGQLGSRN